MYDTETSLKPFAGQKLTFVRGGYKISDLKVENLKLKISLKVFLNHNLHKCKAQQIDAKLRLRVLSRLQTDCRNYQMRPLEEVRLPPVNGSAIQQGIVFAKRLLVDC